MRPTGAKKVRQKPVRKRHSSNRYEKGTAVVTGTEKVTAVTVTDTEEVTAVTGGVSPPTPTVSPVPHLQHVDASEERERRKGKRTQHYLPGAARGEIT